MLSVRSPMLSARLLYSIAIILCLHSSRTVAAPFLGYEAIKKTTLERAGFKASRLERS